MGRSRALPALVTALLFASPVEAQPKNQPTPDQITQAKDLVNKAKDKSTAGDHQAAIDLYLQAYNIAPLPLLLSNVASEFEKIPSKQVEALKYFCQYLEAEPDGPMAGYSKQHAKDLQAALKNPVEDNNVCKPPKIDPGPGSGSGSSVGSGSDTGAGSGSAMVDPPMPPPSDRGKALKLAGMGAVGVGLVGVGIGIVFGLKGKAISDKINSHPIGEAWESNIREEQADGERYNKNQALFLVAGGVFVAAGVGLYALGRSRSNATERTVTLTPVATPSYSGLSLDGRF